MVYRSPSIDRAELEPAFVRDVSEPDAAEVLR